MSTVTARASKPASIARLMRSSVTPGVSPQYSWNHFGPSVSAPTFSIGTDVVLESTCIVPAAAAALATASSPSS